MFGVKYVATQPIFAFRFEIAFIFLPVYNEHLSFRAGKEDLIKKIAILPYKLFRGIMYFVETSLRQCIKHMSQLLSR